MAHAQWNRCLALLVVLSGLLAASAQAADETARFYGRWETSFPANGHTVTLVSVHDAAGWRNFFRTPTGEAPAGAGSFSAADGKYTLSAPGFTDHGTYRFTNDDTLVTTNAAGQTAVWKRLRASAATPAVAAVRPGVATTAPPPAAPAPTAPRASAPPSDAYDASMLPETNAAIAALNRKDNVTAWKNFMAAAQKGDAAAEAGVGAMLFKHLNPPGTGYYAQCEQWLLRSANQGYPKGMDLLAQYYYASGVAVAGGINPGVNNAPIPPALQQQAEGKFTLARQWFERAASKGDVYAMGNLAIMLDSGIGGPRDAARAAQLRAQVKAGPDANFAQRVTSNSGDSAMGAAWMAGHYADAVQQATVLARQGDVKAEALLARAYYVGQGVAVDDHAAFSWAQKAAAANNPDGLLFLGQCYANGRGVGRNLTKASDLFDKAIAAGSTEAMSARSGIDWAIGRGRSPSGGPVFCNKGTSDTMGGCVGEDGKNLDPTTGKPVAGQE